MYLEITKTGSNLDVVYGVYGDGVKYPHETRYYIEDLKKIEKFGNYVAVTIKDERQFYLVHEQTEYYVIVEAIDGVQPTSLDDLFSKLKALK